MREDYLLKTENAARIYAAVRDLPIIDYHNHVSVADVQEGRKFADIYELWIKSDPYKHRLMRISGVAEEYITGSAPAYEKFKKYCEIFPTLAGNPVYDWSRMEMSSIFGIDAEINLENAEYIYEKCNKMLVTDEFSAANILKRFNIEYHSPVISLLDDISGFGGGVAPSLRADNLLMPTEDLTRALTDKTGIKILDDESYIAAISIFLDKLHAAGCRVADHALDSGFFENDALGVAQKILKMLAGEYAKRGWIMLLHLDAKRKTSKRLSTLAGAAGGYAAVGGSFPIASLTDLLGEIESEYSLPDTVLFPLNMGDIAPLAVMQGSFSEDNVPSKVQLGPAWWWCDHKLGIEATLDAISSFGVLSGFIGMTTDSRSILSFVRHDYFRRILASYIDKKNVECEWELSVDTQCEIAKRICYYNVKEKISRR